MSEQPRFKRPAMSERKRVERPAMSERKRVERPAMSERKRVERPAMSERKRVEWYVYILRCTDNSYYVGHTQDVAQRVVAHNAGEGASWTATRRPVTLVYQERLESQTAAIRRERQIKKWSRAKKAALVARDQLRLRQLSTSRQRRG